MVLNVIAKLFIVILMIGMIVALAMALRQLLSPNRDSDKLAKALTWRIGIWVVLLAFIVIAVQLKWLTPSETLIRNSAPAIELNN